MLQVLGGSWPVLAKGVEKGQHWQRGGQQGMMSDCSSDVGSDAVHSNFLPGVVFLWKEDPWRAAGMLTGIPGDRGLFPGGW